MRKTSKNSATYTYLDTSMIIQNITNASLPTVSRSSYQVKPTKAIIHSTASCAESGIAVNASSLIKATHAKIGKREWNIYHRTLRNAPNAGSKSKRNKISNMRIVRIVAQKFVGTVLNISKHRKNATATSGSVGKND